MRRLRLTGLLIVAVVLVAAACSSSSSSSSTSTTTTSSAAPTGGGGDGGGSTATITASGFAFSPSTVNVTPGKVTLTVTNNDSTLHTFTLDDGSSDTDLPPGQTTTIKLDLSNTVGWHCKIHPSMTGTLNVG
jgi:plastocyanin